MPSEEGEPPICELRRDFGLDVKLFTPYPVGFESECWIVDEQWFVKVWHCDGSRADLGLLDRLADNGLPVPRPLRPDVVLTNAGRPYAVFPYVPGRYPTGDDWAEVAGMLRRVHDTATNGLGLPTPPLTDEPLEFLRSGLRHPWVADRADELSAWLDRFETVTMYAPPPTCQTC